MDTDPAPLSTTDQVVVAPDRGACLRWAAFAAVVLAAAAWLLVASGGGPVALALFLASAVATGWFAVQGVAPSASTLVVSAAGVAGRRGWRRVDVPFGPEDEVGVEPVVGEPTIVVEGPDGRRTVALPFGADPAPTRDLLARRRGGGARPAG